MTARASSSSSDGSTEPAASSSGRGLPEWPKEWLKGVGLSVWQNSFDEDSQWSSFVQRKKIIRRETIEEFKDPSVFGDFWNHYKSDIQLAKDLGCNSFRISLEWARFYPQGPAEIVEATVARYHDIIDTCESLGMSVMVTLHHFTHPQWFEASGGWANDDNIPVFVAYACNMMRRFGHRVRLWATFNEPTCFAFVGYILGLWAPGEVMKFKRAGTVLLNMLRSHVAAYKALRAMPESSNSLIGLVHQHIRFFPKPSIFYTRLLCKWMTYWFGTDVMLAFFSKGQFTWRAPWVGQIITYSDTDAPKCLDWWGINYYSRPVLDWKFARTCFKDERITDTFFRIFPQGLYDSVVEASILKVPMLVTETGLADDGDKLRDFFIRSHYQQVLRAVKDGYDIRGVFFWTLLDNIEWHEGFHIKFGLYKWDPVIRRTQGALKLREGSKTLLTVHQAWPASLEAVRRYVAEGETWPALAPLLLDPNDKSCAPFHFPRASAEAPHPVSYTALMPVDDTSCEVADGTAGGTPTAIRTPREDSVTAISAPTTASHCASEKTASFTSSTWAAPHPKSPSAASLLDLNGRPAAMTPPRASPSSVRDESSPSESPGSRQRSRSRRTSLVSVVPLMPCTVADADNDPHV